MEFITLSNRIYAENQEGNIIAEVTFPNVSSDTVNINHTFVDPSLRGKGVADQLLNRVANNLRSDNKRAQLTCSYAIRWFHEHPEHADLVAK